MIIIAVVIVIAVVVSSILGEFPGVGGSTDEKINDYKLEVSKISVTHYVSIGDDATGNSTIRIRNNNFETSKVKDVYVNGKWV